MTFKIEWIDKKREPVVAPDPRYPLGVDVDGVTDPKKPRCKTALPYPAKRCGTYLIVCTDCGFSAAVTTAGRPDDPRSFETNCLPIGHPEGSA